MNLQESIRRILREEIPSQVRRRFSEYDRIFKNYRKSFLPNEYRNSDIFWNMLMEVSMATFYHAWFSKTVSDEDWDDSSDMITNYLTKTYEDETKQMWEKKHHKRLNESKTPNYPKLINDILSYYKDEDFICDIDVSYYNEVYEIAVKIDKKEFEKKYEKENIDYATILMTGYLDKLKRNIRQDIQTLLPVDVLVWFRQINCDKKLNESEDNEEKKIQKNLIVLNKLISMFDYSEVCDMWVRYNSEDGDYEIRSKMSTKNHNTSALEKEFDFLENSIKSLGFTNCYVFRPYYVDQCEDEIKYMNESEDKKSKLLSIIEENGLYELISYTGLHINEVEQMVGQLSREVLERFIIDVLKEHSHNSVEQSQTYVIDLDSWPLDPVPVGNNDYVERIRVTNNELSFTVMLYEEDEYGDLEETSWEVIPSNNLEYDNIYEIAGQLCYYLVKGQL